MPAALAAGTCARKLVVLGYQQVLEHLLACQDTVPPDRRLFLGRTWRMHPGICEFVSEMS